MALEIVNRQRLVVIDRGAIRQLVAMILEDHGQADADVSVVLARDGLLEELNSAYRDLDRPTDVLSFGLNESKGRSGSAGDSPEALLGDVIISVDRAKANAARYGKTPEREILKLVAHGVLHLLGHEHGDPKKRRVMRDRENRYLRKLGGQG